MGPSEVLKKYWNHDSFRSRQLEIIQAVLEGKDTLALLPTGGGKSICYQIPGFLLEGMCLVISPLIALMKDQVEDLNDRGLKAAALHSAMNGREIDITLDNCAYGNIKFLYVSPERLESPLFRARMEKIPISVLAVDEAHCISQWGYDFRPPYLEIGGFRQDFDIQRIIAVTATATNEVRNDIVDKLGLKDPLIFSTGFSRENLSYSVRKTERKDEQLEHILKKVPGPSVIYVRSRKMCSILAQKLSRLGFSADYYHAGLSASQRNDKQNRWIADKSRIMVATNAFGMGIDKPNVRTVLHYDLPDTLEAYYQEAGRAGRDQQKAYAVILFHDQDIDDLRQRVQRSSVDMDLLRRTYQALANHFRLAVGSGEDSSYTFDYGAFVKTFDLPPFETYHALKKLDSEGLIRMTEGFFQRSSLHWEMEHDDLYKFQVSNAALDPVIKAILRLYGGEMYTNFIEIMEGDLARILKVESSQVVKWLDYLHKSEVLTYKKATSKPQVHFVKPRMDINNLGIDPAKIKKRKAIVFEKMEGMIRYCLSSHRCRTRILQSYFGEETEKHCGVCDYCVSLRRGPRTVDPELILAGIDPDGIRLQDLAQKLSADEQELLESVRFLVERGALKITGDQIVRV